MADTSTLQWTMLFPTTSKSGVPMRKSSCRIVAFRDGEEDILCVVAGYGPTPSHRQPGAQYEAQYSEQERSLGISVNYFLCNEHHMFSLSTSE